MNLPPILLQPIREDRFANRSTSSLTPGLLSEISGLIPLRHSDNHCDGSLNTPGKPEARLALPQAHGACQQGPLPAAV
jgi:hypothetical protein